MALDGRQAICQRIRSRWERRGKKGRVGWLHNVKGVRELPPKTEKVYLTPEQVHAYLVSITSGGTGSMIERQASLLGVSVESLYAFFTRYDSDKAVLAFPMFDAVSYPVGVRFRRADGRKWALKGSHEGVFVERDYDPHKPSIICEGPSNSVAMWTMGFRNIIGRPNCSGAIEITTQLLLRGDRRQPVLIVADPDEPGIVGAVELANELLNPVAVVTGATDARDHLLKYTQSSKLTTPPYRDIIESLHETEGTGWRTIYRNQLGQFQDFSKVFERCQFIIPSGGR